MSRYCVSFQKFVSTVVDLREIDDEEQLDEVAKTQLDGIVDEDTDIYNHREVDEDHIEVEYPVWVRLVVDAEDPDEASEKANDRLYNEYDDADCYRECMGIERLGE